MAKLNIPLDGFYESDSLPILAQSCNNWFVNVPQSAGALSSPTLFGSAGIDLVLSTGEVKQANRGAHVKSGIPYFLNGEMLYRVDRTFDADSNPVYSAVSLGVIPGTNRAWFADNGTQLMILVDGKGYIVDEASVPVFQEITDPDFLAVGTPETLVYIDSFFVVSTDEKKILKSASNDGLNWNALEFGSAESDPDAIAALHVYNNKLYVMGAEVSSEEFQNLGLPGFPFQRTGFFIDKGCYAPFSVISSNNSFMWVGGGENEGAAIWTLSGNSAQKVSTTAIDAALQDYNDQEISQIFAYSYAQEGAYFVGFSLPDRTFEYNVITGKWNERTSQVVNTKGVTNNTRWRANSIATAYGLTLCGDSQDGRIGTISIDTYSEYGSEIIREFSTQPLSDLGNAISIPYLEITMESGVGDLEVTDPKIRLSTSTDSKKFSNELTRDIGRLGEFYKRSYWTKLGRFPRWAVMKFVMSDKVKPVVVKIEGRVRSATIGQ